MRHKAKIRFNRYKPFLITDIAFPESCIRHKYGQNFGTPAQRKIQFIDD